METVDIHATFGAGAGDRATLSKSSRATIDALYRHPLARNLEWAAVVALFEKLGTVEHKPHNEIAFGIAGEHHVMRKAHAKDLAAADVMEFRHMLSRAGWSPVSAGAAADAPGGGKAGGKAGGRAGDAARPADNQGPSLLIVIEHHDARIYHMELHAADPLAHVIKPYDPHHVLHHLSHKDKSRERGQRAPEDPTFYKRIADAIVSAGSVVLVGHGKGHSNAAHHLDAYLHQHRPATFQHVVCEVVADLSSLTPPQLLDLGRRALTVEAPALPLDHEGETP